MPADILIYAFVAAGLVFWLRSVLGTRHGGERERPNPFTQTPAKPGAAPATKIAPPSTGGNLTTGLERNMAVAAAPAATDGLAAIAQADKSFNLPHFMKGAEAAFVMIVEAFAAGDRDTLRSLLADPVYAAFSGVLDARTRDGQTSSVEIHAVRRAEIIAAALNGRTASITIRFVADETNVLRDAVGTILHGHPDRITETIDIWTFTRNVKSRDPAWLISETREEERPAS